MQSATRVANRFERLSLWLMNSHETKKASFKMGKSKIKRSKKNPMLTKANLIF